MSQGRLFRPKPKELLGTKYDSTLEVLLDKRLTALVAELSSSVHGQCQPQPQQILSGLTIPKLPNLSTGLKSKNEPLLNDVLPRSNEQAEQGQTQLLQPSQPLVVTPNGTESTPLLPSSDSSLKAEKSMALESQTASQSRPTTTSKIPVLAYHSSKVPYVIEKTYNPDFTLTYPDGREVFVEAKGYFQDAQEIQKYDWVRSALKEHQELVFVFEKPSKPIHFRSVRKDGTKMTHGEWADKLKFRHYTIQTVGELLT